MSLMNKDFKENKLIPFYVLVNKTDESNYLTICARSDQAFEYLPEYIKMKHMDHFKLWCDVRNYDIEAASSWNKYMEDCIDIDEFLEYEVLKITFPFSAVVSFLRMFNGCAPLNCSFITDLELEYFQDIAKNEEIKEEENGSK